MTNLVITELDGEPVVVSAMHEQPTAWEGADRELAVWDLRNGQLRAGPFTGYAGFATRIAVRELHGVPLLVATNGYTGGVRIWRLDSGELTLGTPLRWRFHLDDVSARNIELADLDGSAVVVAAVDEEVWLIDPAIGGAVAGPLTGHAARITSVQVGELDGRPVVVSGSDDRTVRAWDLATGDPVGKVCEVESVRTIQLSTAYRPDLVAVVRGHGNTAELCDLASGEILARLPADHPGMPLLAIGELDGAPVGVSAVPARIRVWSLDPAPATAPPTTP